MILFPFYLLDDPGDEEGEDEEGHGEEHLEGEQAPPVAARPDVPDGADEKSENEDPDDDAEGGSEEVIPKPHPGQAHAEIHGREGKIDQPKVENRGEPVALDRFVVLLQPVADEGCGEIPAEGAPDPEGGAGAQHGAYPDIEESLIGAEDGAAQRRQQGSRNEQTDAGGVHQGEDHRTPDAGSLQETPQPVRGEKTFYGSKPCDRDGRQEKDHEEDALQQGEPARWSGSLLRGCRPHGASPRSLRSRRPRASNRGCSHPHVSMSRRRCDHLTGLRVLFPSSRRGTCAGPCFYFAPFTA